MASKDKYTKIYPKKREMTQTERDFINYFGSFFNGRFMQPKLKTFPNVNKDNTQEK